MKKRALVIFFVIGFTAIVVPQGHANDEVSANDILQTQSTLASIFERGGTVPEMPNVNGAVALPSFESSNLKIELPAVDSEKNIE